MTPNRGGGEETKPGGGETVVAKSGGEEVGGGEEVVAKSGGEEVAKSGGEEVVGKETGTCPAPPEQTQPQPQKEKECNPHGHQGYHHPQLLPNVREEAYRPELHGFKYLEASTDAGRTKTIENLEDMCQAGGDTVGQSGGDNSGAKGNYCTWKIMHRQRSYIHGECTWVPGVSLKDHLVPEPKIVPDTDENRSAQDYKLELHAEYVWPQERPGFVTCDFQMDQEVTHTPSAHIYKIKRIIIIVPRYYKNQWPTDFVDIIASNDYGLQPRNKLIEASSGEATTVENPDWFPLLYFSKSGGAPPQRQNTIYEVYLTNKVAYSFTVDNYSKFVGGAVQQNNALLPQAPYSSFEINTHQEKNRVAQDAVISAQSLAKMSIPAGVVVRQLEKVNIPYWVRRPRRTWQPLTVKKLFLSTAHELSISDGYRRAPPLYLEPQYRPGFKFMQGETPPPGYEDQWPADYVGPIDPATKQPINYIDNVKNAAWHPVKYWWANDPAIPSETDPEFIIDPDVDYVYIMTPKNYFQQFEKENPTGPHFTKGGYPKAFFRNVAPPRGMPIVYKKLQIAEDGKTSEIIYEVFGPWEYWQIIGRNGATSWEDPSLIPSFANMGNIPHDLAQSLGKVIVQTLGWQNFDNHTLGLALEHLHLTLKERAGEVDLVKLGQFLGRDMGPIGAGLMGTAGFILQNKIKWKDGYPKPETELENDYDKTAQANALYIDHMKGGEAANQIDGHAKAGENYKHVVAHTHTNLQHAPTKSSKKTAARIAGTVAGAVGSLAAFEVAKYVGKKAMAKTLSAGKKAFANLKNKTKITDTPERLKGFDEPSEQIVDADETLLKEAWGPTDRQFSSIEELPEISDSILSYGKGDTMMEAINKLQDNLDDNQSLTDIDEAILENATEQTPQRFQQVIEAEIHAPYDAMDTDPLASDDFLIDQKYNPEDTNYGTMETEFGASTEEAANSLAQTAEMEMDTFGDEMLEGAIDALEIEETILDEPYIKYSKKKIQKNKKKKNPPRL
jgi:hypothetical protein